MSEIHVVSVLPAAEAARVVAAFMSPEAAAAFIEADAPRHGPDMAYEMVTVSVDEQALPLFQFSVIHEPKEEEGSP
jgi:hypothetical protein